MKESEIRERLRQGWLRAIVTFEVAGKPKEHVEESLDKYLENIRTDSRIVFLEEEREEAIAHEDGMFSAFSESELLIHGLETFTWLCVNFSPASIEVIEPDQFSIPAREVTNWLNDLLAKVHSISSEFRDHVGTREHLTLAMNQLIKNAILLSLRQGPKPAERIAGDTGIEAEQLAPFLEHMEKKGAIERSGENYALPK